MDGDGELDWGELKNGFEQGELTLSRGLMLERLTLEVGLFSVMIKLLNFMVYFAAFLVAIYIFSPAGQLSQAHTFISDHFKLDDEELGVLEVRSVADIYVFIQRFNTQNKLLKATGDLYWCDPRFFDDLGETPEGSAHREEQAELAAGGGHRMKKR